VRTRSIHPRTSSNPASRWQTCRKQRRATAMRRSGPRLRPGSTRPLHPKQRRRPKRLTPLKRRSRPSRKMLRGPRPRRHRRLRSEPTNRCSHQSPWNPCKRRRGRTRRALKPPRMWKQLLQRPRHPRSPRRCGIMRWRHRHQQSLRSLPRHRSPPRQRRPPRERSPLLRATMRNTWCGGRTRPTCRATVRSRRRSPTVVDVDSLRADLYRFVRSLTCKHRLTINTAAAKPRSAAIAT
jgi:hypothetical protein